MGIEGQHGDAVARGERGEQLLGLPDGAQKAAQATALEVLLEEEDEEACPRGIRPSGQCGFRGFCPSGKPWGRPVSPVPATDGKA